MKNYFVVGTSDDERLAKKIAKGLQAKFLKTTRKVFPDGESKITIQDNIINGIGIVVSSSAPPVDSKLVQILSLIAKSREKSSDVIAVVPYMGYAKQDKEFLEGEIITISVIAKLFKAAGATKLIVVDFHSPDALIFFKLPTMNLSTIGMFSKHFEKYPLKDPLVVAPDLYWKSQAEKFAENINAKVYALNKYRDRKTGKLLIKQPPIKISKKCDLIIYDDMVSTGESILKVIQFLKRKNFRKIYVACTHPVLVGDSEKKIKKAGVVEIIGTNSIPGKYAKIDLSKIIVETIRKWD